MSFDENDTVKSSFQDQLSPAAFDKWHAGLNKIVNPTTGEPVTMDAGINAPAVLATPEEVAEIKQVHAENEAWLAKVTENSPKFVDKNGSPVAMDTNVSNLDL